ncbi:hypothetical protein [Campylobacter concisus]|uniref:hypothetical protein n=1 Tax=Campylobacter concisus TaxID=199 RepID=UPI00122C3AE4|nr:hypothetical protein [Campylobacter concisus]
MGLAYSMLNYSNDATDVLINDDLTQRLEAIKEKIRTILNMYYKNEGDRIAKLINSLDLRTINTVTHFSITAEQVGLNLLSLNLPYNERLYKVSSKNIASRKPLSLAPVLEQFWLENKDEIWTLLDMINVSQYEKYALDSERLAYFYIEQMRAL